MANKGTLSSLESTLEEYFVKKAPFQIPDDIKEAIVKFGPWLVLILLILSLPTIFASIGIGSVYAPLYSVYGRSGYWVLPMIINLIGVVLEVIALPGLFKRTMQGWKMLFYSQIVFIVGALVSYNIVGAIMMFLIGFYILFQVKEKYK